jgi:hypothetical protein
MQPENGAAAVAGTTREAPSESAGKRDQIAASTQFAEILEWHAKANEACKDRRRKIYSAAKTGRQCARCGHEFTPDEPVWRRRLSFGSTRWAMAPLCERCRTDRQYLEAAPCEGCGRPVHNEMGFRPRRRTFCCEDCDKAAVAKAARERRSDARGTRQCDSCGETFEPSRTDARYCSNACRQRAHRRRTAVTADEVRDGETFVSRNDVTARGHTASETFASRNADEARPKEAAA